MNSWYGSNVGTAAQQRSETVFPQGSFLWHGVRATALPAAVRGLYSPGTPGNSASKQGGFV
ncbi:hypothetical protein ACN4EG_15060 [Alkalinema pantanalense CENA528]|uniref:hypothetical protein n=1 Tax=Alkalinema pantanalense TaxID=1620705 RepID=UPI003D6F9EFC